ncbi:MAG: class I SAM-dependent methyltransferase [Elusimicrobia bacterium]|nr:class I SAM-dependent methyltransferase [Elusimicrobiota bacterium]
MSASGSGMAAPPDVREDGDGRRRYFEYLPARRDDAFIRAMIDGLERYVSLADRARVLDFGCGAGRQTVEIARRGCRVLGVDSDAPRLSQARTCADNDKSLWVHFTRKDLRHIGYESEFDVAVNLHHPLGRGEGYDRRCLQAVWRALRPAGKLVMDMPSRDWVVRNLDQGAGLPLFDLKTGRFQAGLRIYSLTEIVGLLEEARFAVREVHGGWNHEPFGLDSMRMILVAGKLPPEARSPREEELPKAIRIKGRGR